MKYVVCSFCSKEFLKKPSQIVRCERNFCSRLCQQKSSRSGEWMKCFLCEKDVYKQRQFLSKSKSQKFFCGRKCALVFLNSDNFGKNSNNWKHGRYSYRNIMKRKGDKYICKLCGKDDKRVLAVHHIDKNRFNNRPKNLAWLCYNCHFLVHHYSEARERFLSKL